MQSRANHYFAIDAGGSRLRGYDSVSKKDYVGEGATHTSSLAVDLARNIVAFFPAEISEIDLLVLSLAAIPQSSDDLELLASAIYQRVSFDRLVIASDTKAASLSSDTHADLVIAVGTGITASVNTGDKHFELSGLGYLIGDEGSGYWIGRYGLNAALKAVEGRGVKTKLTESALNLFKVDHHNLADHIHQLPSPVTQIAAFAPFVVAAAESGDALALSIIETAASEIVNLIKVAIERAEIKSVSLVGGAIPSGGLLHNKVTAECKNLNIAILDSKSEPLAGARKIAESNELQTDLISLNTSEIKVETWSRLYLTFAKELLDRVSNDQSMEISKAVKLFSDALVAGKMIHTFGTGHSHLLAEEIFYRAGGLAAIYPILDERIMLHQEVVTNSQNERLPGLAEDLLENHLISKGDVVVVISNSGGNQVTIDLVKLAQSAGATVIALTSINHATSNSARSNSAEKIHQLADLVLDNSGVVGDAAVRIAGSKMAVGPTSTVIGGAILQSIVVGTVAQLIKLGIEPEIFLSSNLAGGDANNAAIFDKYRPLISLYN
jgi:uncharacterized phosphosugar-binding protein/N-acetylglucosamine kinase-like BadF-type ATPase